MFYDARSQLIDFNGQASFAYDQDGRRISATTNAVTTNYLWDEFSQYGDVILETGANTVSYTLANGMVLSQTTNGITNYLLPDAQNSTRAVTNAAGNITSNYDYDAFGNLQGSPSLETNYLYTGQQYDATSELYSLRARYYDPAYGRFLSSDTYPYDIGNPIELNRYGYTANNPVNFYDPSGNSRFFTYAKQLAIDVGIASSVAVLGYSLVCRTSESCMKAGGDAIQRAIDALPTADEFGKSISDGFNGLRKLWDLIQALRNTDRLLRWLSKASSRAEVTSEEARIQELTEAQARELEDDDGKDIAYRNPDPSRQEHPTALVTGFYPKAADAQYTASEHIREGSTIQTQWISLTRNLGLALMFKTSDPIYVINLNEVVGLVYDFTIPSVRAQLDAEASRIARAASEVLVLGWIPPTAIEGIIP